MPLRRHSLYIAIVSSMYGVSSIAGPLLGGVYSDSPPLTWRFCVWANLRNALLPSPPRASMVMTKGEVLYIPEMRYGCGGVSWGLDYLPLSSLLRRRAAVRLG